MSRPPSPADFYQASAYCADDSVGYLMKRVLMAITLEADRQLEPDGLTHIQWGPLFMLRSARASTVAELARELQTDAGAMTRLLDRLEAKGLCRRERSTADRRVVRIALTPEGEKAAARVPVVLSQIMNQILAGFTRDEWSTLKAMLQRMLENVEAERSRSEASMPASRPARARKDERATREAR
ncbi:MAG TPA: MarR family transcriptional regulator [Caldimonas sp.]|jgi:DNA-binding MarR family transcriptional regulator